MKKIYLLLLLLVGIGAGINAQCVVDTTNTTLGISPPDSLFPVVTRNVPYDTVAQVYVPATFTYLAFTVNIRWVVIDTIKNAPTGISYLRNPTNDTTFAGHRACYQIFGTTSDTVGVYKLNFEGFVRFSTALLNGGQDTTWTLAQLTALAGTAGPQFGFHLRVVDPNGINDISYKLASALQVMPNPNNGQFDVKLNYNGELTGDIKVFDATGRVVYSQPMSSRGLYTNSINLANLPKGIYAVQLTTTNGVASKLVSVE